MANNKQAFALGLAQKAGKLVSGDFAVKAALKAGTVQLLVVAQDTAPNSKKELCYLAAQAGVPVLADGFISGVAALCAVRLCPAAAKAVFASHCSAEPAARMVLEALGKAPIITAGLHLGEGTGAVASLPLWDMAMAVYNGCYSFTEGGIAPYTPQC